MHRRHDHLNLPTEIIRTVIAISEEGSLSKAADRLGLSQPAVSSQIKRIQTLLGGELFAKTPNGATTTVLGRLVLDQARRMMDANDQILRLGGGTVDGPQPLRLGISSVFVQDFFQNEDATKLSGIVMHADNSLAITKSFVEGFIDVAYVLYNSEITADVTDLIINEREEPFVWARAQDFVVRPGAPIPILTWPGDDILLRVLARKGLAYSIVFTSPDYYAKIQALEAGIGLAALPKRMVPPSLIQAHESYLPPLPLAKTLLCARRNMDAMATGTLKKISHRLFEPR